MSSDLPDPAAVVAPTHAPLKISSRQIALINALAEYRNLRKAAAAMHTTQPAASLLLQQLEERIGVPLFTRLPRGMEPTAFGEVLIRFAQGVVHEFSHAESEIRELAAGAAGLARIGTVVGPVPSLITRSLLAFKADNPRVRISVDVGTSDMLLPSLIRGDLDVVIGRLPDRSSHPEVEVELFGTPEHMRVIGRPQHPATRIDKLALKDLVTLTWILHPVGSPMRLRVENILALAGMTDTLDVIETSNLLATTAMIEASDMISVVPEDVAQYYARYAMVAVLPVELPLPMVNLGLLTLRGRALSAAVTRLIQHLREQGGCSASARYLSAELGDPPGP
ncbi:LysR family transcriptional regulator [Caballeronia sp. NK8]|uniref:LysR family transcriptional regulator n=1 Tax=Caballeronia sp. NK8 TaxID=140098 RepID=UPI001BB77CA6|nr:LysR family transcriptional regulator [Caballeronia sp. NK8]BCQ26323.1 LysR family transcriptional regulator [Caballeronia sp. NK8]